MFESVRLAMGVRVKTKSRMCCSESWHCRVLRCVLLGLGPIREILHRACLLVRSPLVATWIPCLDPHGKELSRPWPRWPARESRAPMLAARKY